MDLSLWILCLTGQWRTDDHQNLIMVHRRKLVCFSSTSWGWPSVWVSYLENTSALRCRESHWGLCYALGDVLLGAFGSCSPCGCYFDRYHLPKLWSRPSCSLMVVDLPQRKNASRVQPVWSVALASKFPRSESNPASVGEAANTCNAIEVPPQKPTGLKDAANFLKPDTRNNCSPPSGIRWGPCLDTSGPLKQSNLYK